jgi:hypothetical protein
MLRVHPAWDWVLNLSANRTRPARDCAWDIGCYEADDYPFKDIPGRF